ncbi:hypothetical protein HDU97_003848 [Phlyctochytrium planicorne]|nr:hypothetical protein HDU97_003848 [Phlyctochytrium planicorne]
MFLGVPSMLASSCRRTITTSAVRKPGFRRMDIHVVLREDVAKLGKAGMMIGSFAIGILTMTIYMHACNAGDIVMVPTKAARNYLVPFKLAYYVPRSGQKPILPENWTPPIQEDSSLPSIIYPAEFDLSSTSFSDKQKKKAHAEVSSDTTTTVSLDDIKELKFLKPVIVEGESRIFGSVSADDVVQKIKDDFGIVVDKHLVVFAGAKKIKQLGVHRVTITGFTEIDIVVEAEVESPVVPEKSES